MKLTALCGEHIRLEPMPEPLCHSRWFARASDSVVIDLSRLFDLETWVWPEGHPRYGRIAPDVIEINIRVNLPAS